MPFSIDNLLCSYHLVDSKKLVQINFNYDLAREELNEGAKEFVHPVQQVPNLVWKTWVVNDQEKLTGGIYLFENEEAAKAKLKGLSSIRSGICRSSRTLA